MRFMLKKYRCRMAMVHCRIICVAIMCVAMIWVIGRCIICVDMMVILVANVGVAMIWVIGCIMYVVMMVGRRRFYIFQLLVLPLCNFRQAFFCQ